MQKNSHAPLVIAKTRPSSVAVSNRLQHRGRHVECRTNDAPLGTAVGPGRVWVVAGAPVGTSGDGVWFTSLRCLEAVGVEQRCQFSSSWIVKVILAIFWCGSSAQQRSHVLPGYLGMSTVI